MRILLVDGFCNALIAPLLGVPIVTPLFEGAAGIVLGARTGLASTVTGLLFLLSCLFAAPIATIVPLEASGGVTFVACCFVIQYLQYIDYDNMAHSVPALMAFFLVPFTSSISVGASFSFVALIGIWALTPFRAGINPQMVAAFTMAVLLLVVETGLVVRTTAAVLGALVGGFVAFAVVSIGLMYQWRKRNAAWMTSKDAEAASRFREWCERTGEHDELAG